MARQPIKGQNKVGAQSSSRVQGSDTYVQTLADTSQSDKFGKLSQLLGTAQGIYQQHQASERGQEIAQAEDDFAMGYAHGILDDGEKVRKGEMDFADSPYFRKGVAVFQAGTEAMTVGAGISKLRTQLEEEGGIPVDEEEYVEWYAQAQADMEEKLGIDHTQMSPFVQQAYAGKLREMQQADFAVQKQYVNQRVAHESERNFSMQLDTLLRTGDDPAVVYQQIEGLLSTRASLGFNGTKYKMLAYEGLLNIAKENSDPDMIREYAENAPFMNVQIRAQANADIELLEDKRQREEELAEKRAGKAADDHDKDVIGQYIRAVREDPYASPDPYLDSLNDPYAMVDALEITNKFAAAREKRMDPMGALSVLTTAKMMALNGDVSGARRFISQQTNISLTPEQAMDAFEEAESWQSRYKAVGGPAHNALRSRVAPEGTDEYYDVGKRTARLVLADQLFIRALDEWYDVNLDPTGMGPSQPTSSELYGIMDQITQQVLLTYPTSGDEDDGNAFVKSSSNTSSTSTTQTIDLGDGDAGAALWKTD